MKISQKHHSMTYKSENSDSTSCWKTLSKKVKEISSNTSNILSKLWHGVPESERKFFDRKAGYWNSEEDERNNGFFSSLIKRKDQREHWYKVTPYVAEFWCTLSNAGFIHVGINRNAPELVFAGLASAASHTNPKQWLLTIDKVGVLVAFTKLLRNYQGVIDKPWLIAPIAAAGLIISADTYLAHSRPTTASHVTWHLSAAYISDVILKNI